MPASLGLPKPRARPSTATTCWPGLTGRVVEVGAGNGLNFAHYPNTVTEVVAVEPEPHLRDLAEEAASRRLDVGDPAGRHGEPHRVGRDGTC